MAKKHDPIKLMKGIEAVNQLNKLRETEKNLDYYKSRLPEFIIEITDYLHVNSRSSFNLHTNRDMFKNWVDYYANTHPNFKKEDFYPSLQKLLNDFSTLVVEAYQSDLQSIQNNKKGEWEKEQIQNKQMTFTPKDVVAMSDIFGIKTENTVGKYLDKGIIRGKQINKKWQISREALREYIGHDNF